ncbi:MAG: hypothetical protein J5841_02770 [Clostridia bacterium]|nr:hypothetical protein [Clostridia bacterium]
MSTETKKKRERVWFLPLVLALPFLAVIAAIAVRFGPTVIKLISVAIKAAVVS